MPSFLSDGVEIAYLSAAEIAANLARGAVHLGVTGEDLVRESIPDADRRVLLIDSLGFGSANVVVAVPQAWIDVRIERNVLADGRLERLLQFFNLRIIESHRAGDARRYFTTVTRGQCAESLDHVGGGEKPAVLRDQIEKIGSEAPDAGLLHDRRHGAGLILGRDNGRAHHAPQILALVQQSAKCRQIRFDLFDFGGLFGQIEKCGGVTPSHSFNDCVVRCHVALIWRLARRIGGGAAKTLDVAR